MAAYQPHWPTSPAAHCSITQPHTDTAISTWQKPSSASHNMKHFEWEQHRYAAVSAITFVNS